MAPQVDENLLAKLLLQLGYTSAVGYYDLRVPSGRPDSLVLRQARSEMSVLGVFGLRPPAGHSTDVSERYRPLVYVAEAADKKGAQEVHRRVWSQGCVPLLLVLTPTELWLCNGFSFSSRDWDKQHISVAWPNTAECAELRRYSAYQLRSSLSWANFCVDSTSRVDDHLVRSLQCLTEVFKCGKFGARTFTKLKTATANALMGKLLYVYFLHDRQIINKQWLAARGHHHIDIDNRHIRWPLSSTWDFFDDLDSLFNGSVFPISTNARRRVGEEHIQLVRDVIRHGDVLIDGSAQLSFLDFYFPVLRTETLSAVYEHFLQAESPIRKKREGIFYTPPFLADYVLDRLEDTLSRGNGGTGIRSDVPVFDAAAGSGIFLVGAFRRMIERVLSESRVTTWPIAELHRLLTENIFAVERRRAACQVAAFSLSLTLLDYAPKDEVRAIAEGKLSRKLFPAILDKNILTRDFFDTRPLPSHVPAKFDCIMGNPPWSRVSDLRSRYATMYMESLARRKQPAPVDDEQAAELFAWKCLHEHLREEGTMGLILPAKSFVGSDKNRFATEFAKSALVRGVANLSHFRYKLFPTADSPAAVVIIQNRDFNVGDRLWVHAPTLAGQPTDTRGSLWAIFTDRADLTTFRYQDATETPQAWFEALMLHPIDRRVLEHLRQLCATRHAATIAYLERHLTGFRVKPGASEARTGVSAAFLLGSGGKNDYLMRLAGDGKNHVYELPKAEQVRMNEAYQGRFGGNIVLFPRGAGRALFVEKPVAFKSTLLALYFEPTCPGVPEERRTFLQAVERYLESDFFSYVRALIGRHWLLDGRRFEDNDLHSVPMPFTHLQDRRVAGLLNASQRFLEKTIHEFFELPLELSLAAKEYASMRKGFKNGGIPARAMSPVQDGVQGTYQTVLENRLSGFVGEKNAFSISVHNSTARALAVVDVCYLLDETSSHGRTKSAREVMSDALSHYDSHGGSIFTDSVGIKCDPGGSRLLLTKPHLTHHWTAERAYADAGAILDALMAFH